MLVKVGQVPVLERVIKTALALNPCQIIVVHSKQNKKDLYANLSNKYNLTWVEQKDKSGTAGALMSCVDNLESSEQVLVLCGDHPFYNALYLTEMLDSACDLAIMSCTSDNPAGKGGYK